MTLGATLLEHGGTRGLRCRWRRRGTEHKHHSQQANTPFVRHVLLKRFKRFKRFKGFKGFLGVREVQTWNSESPRTFRTR
jgi:hypothetical protein